MMDTEMQTAGNRQLLAIWLVLTAYNEELNTKTSPVSRFTWNWFRAFCSELRITTLYNFVNVTITRAEASARWFNLSAEIRQCLSRYFGMTPEDIVDDVRAVLVDLCTERSHAMSEETQRSVVIEIWRQARMAINTSPWCRYPCQELLELKLPEPQIEW